MVREFTKKYVVDTIKKLTKEHHERLISIEYDSELGMFDILIQMSFIKLDFIKALNHLEFTNHKPLIMTPDTHGWLNSVFYVYCVLNGKIDTFDSVLFFDRKIFLQNALVIEKLDDVDFNFSNMHLARNKEQEDMLVWEGGYHK